MEKHNTSSRDSFNLKIIDKQENYLVVEVMIVNPEQKFFYRGKLFFVQAFWRAIKKYSQLENKPFFALINYERAWKDMMWLMKNSKKAILSFEVLSLKNYPLLHSFDESKEVEWEKVWN